MGPWVLHASPSRIWFEPVSVAATIRTAWAEGCWMTEAAINRHRGGSQTAPDVVLSTIAIPPPELQELRLRFREALAKIGYYMAAGMGTDEPLLLPDPLVTS